MRAPERTDPGLAAAAWALAGVTALLSFATVRLGVRGLATVRQGLGPIEWAVLAVLVLLFVWIEGRQAFEQRWVPRVLRRAEGLRYRRGLPQRLLAPLYAMSLIGDSRRNVARAWSLTAGIAALVLIVASLPEPWRGIIDLAVAAALAWGVGALVVQTANRLADGRAHGAPARPTRTTAGSQPRARALSRK
jgi:hypothetical protein